MSEQAQVTPVVPQEAPAETVQANIGQAKTKQAAKKKTTASPSAPKAAKPATAKKPKTPSSHPKFIVSFEQFVHLSLYLITIFYSNFYL